MSQEQVKKVGHAEDTATKINPKLIENNPRFESDVDKASIISRLFFFYGLKLGFRGFFDRNKKDTFDESDVITIPWKERPDVLSDRFTYHMQERKKRKPHTKLNLSLAIFKSVKWPLIYITLVETAFVFIRIFSTWVLKKLIGAYLTGGTDDAYKWAGVLTACLVAGFFTEHHWNFPATYYPTLIQNSLIDIIYGKVTRLSTHALTQISTGRIINLASNGLTFLDNFGMFFPSIFVGIFAMFAGAAVVWQSFGAYTLIGVGYVAAWYPLQALSIFGTTKQRAEQDDITNERVKTTSETVEGIRLLKMYTWEMKFKEKIENLRKKEIEFLRGAAIGGAIGRACAFSVQDCGSFLMFLAYYYTDHTLEVGSVFSAYFVFGYLRIFGSYFISAAMFFIEEAGSVFGAIERILEAPEIGDVKFEQPRDTQNSVEYENFTAYWEDNYQLNAKSDAPKREIQPTLTNVNLNIKKGTVNALVGVVGSGKTSFLMSFTGEMPKTTGKLRYKGNIAYVEQEPTIFAGTFRENVIFGKPFDEERYEKAIKACNLVNDLKLFAKGDQAGIVGGGMNLSGGQKARLAFARAVYSDADIYLLDDPLSAVDPKVARSLYNNAIEGALKGKTIILVTHQVDFVKTCENIIVMENGKVLGSGTLDELKEKGVHPENIFGDDHQKDSSDLDNSRQVSLDEPELKGGPTSTKHHHHQNKPAEHKTKAKTHDTPNHHIVETSPDSLADLNNEKEDHAIISGENFTGRATLQTYIGLFQEMGGWKNALLIFVVILCSQFSIVAYGRILGAWIAGTFPAWKTSAILGGLVGFGIFIFNAIFLVLGLSTLRASKNYHEKMLNKVINAKALFFDVNPVGQIINRFASDIGVMDRFIPLGLTDVLNIVGFLFAIIITAGIINPILLAPLLVALIFALMMIALSYFSVERSKMFELQAKGPVFGLLSETLNGLVIMRMYKQEDSFKRRFRADLHKSHKGNYAFVLASRIGGFYADMGYTIAVIGCIFILTAKSNGDESNAYLAAFSLSLLLGITGLFQYLLRQFSSLNISMASVARLQEFVKIPSEPAQHLEGDREKIQKGWPDQGKIEVSKVYMKYRPDMDFVLKDLDLDVKQGEKIGCVGRTGAGKSTIVQMLYRMREIDRKEKGSTDSHVHFDDVDTQKVGLNLLRKNISMIPQTPYIFSETIRTNIDPLNQHTDEEIWKVLEDVRLKEHIEKQSNGLYTKISGGSSIFSVGQKQLVCLARVVLKPAPVLIMDEATANMDHETDNFLQEKIDQRFGKSTRFTIAHRLTTIANYDKVLVLSKGRKVEYDEPYKLLVNNVGDQEMTNKTGHFSIMVQNTGPISSKQIFDIAKNAYFEKHQGAGQTAH